MSGETKTFRVLKWNDDKEAYDDCGNVTTDRYEPRIEEIARVGGGQGAYLYWQPDSYSRINEVVIVGRIVYEVQETEEVLA